jgi:hypothetical protein
LDVVTFFVLKSLKQLESFGAAAKSRVTVANLEENSPVKDKNRLACSQFTADKHGTGVQGIISVL